MKTNTILQGDCLKQLKTLPEKSINMCMTSPPYWALRDYGVEGQLGLEPTFDEYINKLCDIFDEVKRVLRDDGTCWVNIGDSYGGSGNGQTPNMDADWINNTINPQIKKGAMIHNFKRRNIQPKCLVGIPMRFAIEMVNRGWILRNTIIWHKPNCMPSSVKDRFTVDFEYIFFFSKKKKYYFETQYEPISESYAKDKRPDRVIRQRFYDKSKYVKAGMIKKEEGDIKSLDKRNTKGRNKRTVWSICPRPFKEAHFAVYPEELCETPIKAGCPEQGIVLDPFFGAGTTGLVALKQNKKFIGIELNKEYIDIANKRLKPFMEQKRL